jgi:nucleotide-binding universal stress UspA family protein
MKKILVAVDGSPREPMVLLAAAELAARLDAQLVLFRAVGIPPELPASAMTMSPNDVATLVMKEARKALERRAAELPRASAAHVRVELGTAWRAICEAARAEDAELIVIGSHGYGGIDRLLGTTAAKVVDHADRSVLVVKR